MHYRPQRWRLSKTVDLETSSGTITGEVRCISSTGFRVHSSDGLSRGLRLKVISNGITIPASVAWVSDTRAGIEFEKPQTRKALEAAGLRDH